MSRQIQEQNKQSISNWVLAHTQVAEALVYAWEKFYEEQHREDPEWESKKNEIEKRIGDIFEKSWQNQIEIDKEKNRDQNKQSSYNADCTTKELELSDVTLWRLSLKGLKFCERTIDDVQVQALEYNRKDKQNTKHKKK